MLPFIGSLTSWINGERGLSKVWQREMQSPACGEEQPPPFAQTGNCLGSSFVEKVAGGQEVDYELAIHFHCKLHKPPFGLH